jgi:rhamnose transport system ATP-binding protein
MQGVTMRRYSWEWILAILLGGSVVTAVLLSPLYLAFDQITYSLQQSIAIVGVLGLGFMMVIILGEIDISLPAILAIGTVLLAKLSKAGVPIWGALPIIVVVGTIAGMLNGFLVSTFNLPSLAVTLGTMYAYRGFALLIGGFEGYAADVFSPQYIWLGGGSLGGVFPCSLALLVVLFLILAFVMHRTVFGRLLYAVGNNRVATRFSGYSVRSIITSAYAVAGALSAVAALVYVGQYESARADNASQLLLFVVACVVLGGFDIFGGKGNVVGLALSLLIIGTVQNGMGLANVPGPVQTLVIGLILICALLIPVAMREFSSALSAGRARLKGACPEPADADTPKEPVLAGGQAAAGQPGLPRLQLCDVSKSFGGIEALCGVSFSIMPGEIHALVGENGAGKSTLVKIITGIQAADSGTVLLDGEPIRFEDPMTARRAGVLAVYQDPKLFPNLDVAENVFMGIHPVRRNGMIDRKKMYDRTREVLAPFNVELNPRAVVASLSTAEMQFVEFARALSEGVERLLILDEPTATLSPGDTARLFSIIRKMKSNGTSILLISHRLEELEGLADTITVLRDGHHIATKPAAGVSEDEIVKLMVGRSLDELYGTDRHTASVHMQQKAGEEILRVEDLGQTGVYEGISFSVHAGEVVCLSGLVGAGRTEIAQTIFGITAPTRGHVFVGGEERTGCSTRHMLESGLTYVPENRETEGLISQLSVLKNMSLPSLGALSYCGIMDQRREREEGEKSARDLQIKTSGIDAVVSSLSGGNRQKVVLAKWLALHPRLLILDETTHGIDVGTKAHVHQMIADLAASGIGILIISSDLPEVLRVSDRILVIADGRLVAEFSRSEATQEKIIKAAATGKGGNGNAGSAGASPP